MALPSEGESYIIQYLKKQEISFKAEYKITGLKNDSKSYRVADFYLPAFKVYIEFLGQWNLPEQKERYKEKMNVYFTNNIPVIYIFPENLGVLDFVFHKRLIKVLKEKKMEWQMIKYRFFLLNDKLVAASQTFFLGMVLSIIFIIPKEDREMYSFIGGILVMLYAVYLFVRAIIKAVRC